MEKPRWLFWMWMVLSRRVSHMSALMDCLVRLGPPFSWVFTFQRLVRVYIHDDGKVPGSKKRPALMCKHYLFIHLYLFFFLFHLACSMHKFPGQGSNPRHISDLSHRSDSASSFTLLHIRELPVQALLTIHL